MGRSTGSGKRKVDHGDPGKRTLKKKNASRTSSTSHRPRPLFDPRRPPCALELDVSPRKWNGYTTRTTIGDTRRKMQQVLGAQPWAAETDAFRSGFLQGGGFARVLEVAMAAPADGDRDVILGHASALRILKTCLFYPPLQVLAAPGTIAGGRGREGRRDAAGGGEGVGVAAPRKVARLVPRALPPVSPPCPAARAAMNVPDVDLQRLLDKLVLVRAWRSGRGWAGRGGEGMEGRAARMCVFCLCVC